MNFAYFIRRRYGEYYNSHGALGKCIFLSFIFHVIMMVFRFVRILYPFSIWLHRTLAQLQRCVLWMGARLYIFIAFPRVFYQLKRLLRAWALAANILIWTGKMVTVPMDFVERLQCGNSSHTSSPSKWIGEENTFLICFINSIIIQRSNI